MKIKIKIDLKNATVATAKLKDKRSKCSFRGVIVSL